MFWGRFKGDFQGVSRMFQKSFKGVSRKIYGSFESPLKVFRGSFKDDLRKIQGWQRKWKLCFMKISKKVSRVFQESFDEVFFCNFVVAWISLQLPKQKEGLFIAESFSSLKINRIQYPWSQRVNKGSNTPGQKGLTNRKFQKAPCTATLGLEFWYNTDLF